MARTVSAATLQPCRRPLAACVASLFALAAPAAAIADTWTVNSCDEGSSGDMGTKTGTLRYALAHATSPAIINLTGLTGASACLNSKISLSTGELETSISTVTVIGPAPAPEMLQLDASAMLGAPPSYGDLRVINHTGAGRLTIQNLGITGGHVLHYSFPTDGGCILSTGDVELDNVKVSSCYSANLGSTYAARGGAVSTSGALILDNSTVTGSHAVAEGSTRAIGGALYAAGTIALNNYSAVGGNYAKAASGRARGGGVYSKGDASLTKGSIYYSQASSTGDDAVGGGLYTLGGLTVTDGVITGNSTYSAVKRAIGGGVFVQGNAGITRGKVKYNTASSESYRAYGGGAYIHGGLTLTKSTLDNNQVSSANPFSVAEGGGALVHGSFFTSYSTISDNKANGLTAAGGGLYLNGDIVTINSSTISGNASEGSYAGVVVFTGGAPATSFQIAGSTISGNQSSGFFGGLFLDSATAKFYNTTIAFNTSVGANSGPGVRLGAPPMAVTLQNTLISNNTYGTLENDLDKPGPNPVVFNGGNLATPANNLIRVTFLSPAILPGDTKQGFCPHLGKLRDNGGLTKTHALLSHSVAIDAGNDNLGVLYDQRGAAAVNGTIDYPRISGPNGQPNPKPDIGAYEVQQDDVVFNTDFEDCVPPPV